MVTAPFESHVRRCYLELWAAVAMLVQQATRHMTGLRRCHLDRRAAMLVQLSAGVPCLHRRRFRHLRERCACVDLLLLHSALLPLEQAIVPSDARPEEDEFELARARWIGAHLEQCLELGGALRVEGTRLAVRPR